MRMARPIDWLSIYKHGHDGEAENPWSYVFLSFFRDDPRRDPAGTAQARQRRSCSGVTSSWPRSPPRLFVMFLFNWRYVIFYFLPFFYLGHCFSYLNGYYRHYGANPGQADGLGREQLRQNLQLALLLQRLPRRTSFPAESALDENGSDSIGRLPICRNRKASA